MYPVLPTPSQRICIQYWRHPHREYVSSIADTLIENMYPVLPAPSQRICIQYCRHPHREYVSSIAGTLTENMCPVLPTPSQRISIQYCRHPHREYVSSIADTLTENMYPVLPTPSQRICIQYCRHPHREYVSSIADTLTENMCPVLPAPSQRICVQYCRHPHREYVSSIADTLTENMYPVLPTPSQRICIQYCRHPHREYVSSIAVLRLQKWKSGSTEYHFIAVTLRNTLTWSVVVYSHIYTSTYTCRIHIDAVNKTSEDFFKKYTSHFIVRVVCERELETEQNCNILTPTLMAISVVSFSFSRTAQPEARLSAGWWLPLSHLVSNSSDLQLTDFLSPPSYIIDKSPTQSLEWHVWSSSSGNNCHAVHRSLYSGASVYEYTMGFYLVPYRQPSPPTRFLIITAIGMCHFLPVHHFGMACLAGSKVNIQ